jgi:excisionase family DNA binding protein
MTKVITFPKHKSWHAHKSRQSGGTVSDMHNHMGVNLPPQPTIKQSAEFFGVDVKTVRRWIAQGRLTAYRVGPRLIRIDRNSILKLASPIGGAA